MYQALYRKWRPQTFDQVVGQRHITETLKNQVRTDRLSHAYIFIGTRGTGKTTCARILAKAINCENPVDGNPCCKCAACRGIAEGSFMDIVELDAASNNGVDNVRALREEAVFSPVNLKKRVYIIDEVHMLSQAAFNALLKILEEPPKHLMFILATTELHKVPATILSRCQRHSFRRIDSPAIAEYLSFVAEREGMRLESEAAELIARLAEGGVRDALSLLDQCSGRGVIDLETVYSCMGLAGKRRVSAMLDNIINRDSEKAVGEFSALWMEGKDPATFLEELSGLLRDVLMLKVAPGSAADLISGSYDSKSLKDFSKRMSVEEISFAMARLQESLARMKDMKNTKTAAELCLVSLCHNVGGDSVEELKARLARLEREFERGIPARSSCAEEEEEYESAPTGPVYEYDEAEDDIAADAFIEEQPEDAFLQRDRAAEEKQVDIIQEASKAPAPEKSAAPAEDIWPKVKEKLAKSLPMPLPLNLKDECVRGRQDGEQFWLEVQEGFLYERFKRPNILELVSKAVEEVCGREMRVHVGTLAKPRFQQRDIEELRRFKEVRFID